MVERCFRELRDKATRRGVFVSVPDLTQSIKSYVATHSAKAKPYVWSATVESILAKLADINAMSATLHYTDVVCRHSGEQSVIPAL